MKLLLKVLTAGVFFVAVSFADDGCNITCPSSLAQPQPCCTGTLGFGAFPDGSTDMPIQCACHLNSFGINWDCSACSGPTVPPPPPPPPGPSCSPCGSGCSGGSCGNFGNDSCGCICMMPACGAPPAPPPPPPPDTTGCTGGTYLAWMSCSGEACTPQMGCGTDQCHGDCECGGSCPPPACVPAAGVCTGTLPSCNTTGPGIDSCNRPCVIAGASCSAPPPPAPPPPPTTTTTTTIPSPGAGPVDLMISGGRY